MATTGVDGFEWPWQYNFPPFFTIQPNAETRRKQLDAWCQLVLAYYQHVKQTSLSLSSIQETSCPLFHNKNIQRSVNQDFITSILEELRKRGNLEWTDKHHSQARIIWRTSAEWADLLEKWARASSHGNSVCTLFELTDSEATEAEAFHGLDESVLLDALAYLQKQGKAELMEEGAGVKFFCN